MKTLLLAVAGVTAAMVIGCGSAEATLGAIVMEKPMTFVFPPGYEIDVDGKAAVVVGRQTCPAGDPVMNAIFGAPSDGGSTGCLVIGPATKSVSARVAIDGKVLDETWTVERQELAPARIALFRPGRVPVVEYTAKASPR